MATACHYLTSIQRSHKILNVSYHRHMLVCPKTAHDTVTALSILPGR